jgi:hypothetical protein
LKYQKTLGLKVWTRPCGDVAYQKAVALVTEWAEEHDALITKLEKEPKFAPEYLRYTEESRMWTHADALAELAHVTQTGPDRLPEVSVRT